MDHMDVNSDGYIECHEFVLFFHRTAFIARSEIKSKELSEVRFTATRGSQRGWGPSVPGEEVSVWLSTGVREGDEG